MMQLNGSGSGWTAARPSTNSSQQKSNSSKSDANASKGPYASLLQEDKKRQEELDKLLAGLDQLTETLPDLTPSTRPNSALSVSRPGSSLKSPTNIVRSPTNHLDQQTDEPNVKPSQVVSSLKRSANMANIVAVEREVPYHARVDSKPFSYIRMNGDRPGGSRTVSRASSKEALSIPNPPGLESPSILRKIIGSNGNSSRPTTPSGGVSSNGGRTYSAVESVNVAMPLYSTVNKGSGAAGGAGPTSHMGPVHKTSATILVNGDTNGKSSLIKG